MVRATTGKGRIKGSAGEGYNPGEYRKRVWAITGKGRIQVSNRMVEFGRVPEKGKILASTEEGYKRVLGKIESGRVLEMGRIWASTRNGENLGE